MIDNLLKAFETDGLFYIVNFALFAVVIFVTWLIVNAQNTRELAKLKHEIVAIEMKQVGRLNDLEDECRIIEEDLRELLKDLRNGLKAKDFDKVQAKHGALSNCFYKNYIDAYYKYFRLAETIFREDSSKRIELIQTKLTDFLATSKQVMEVLNQDNILKIAKAKTSVINGHFDFAHQFAQKDMKRLWRKDRNALKSALADFV